VPVVAGSCENHGYRSSGSYCSGWFGGQCGSGHPFYLLCPACRLRYMTRGPAHEGQQTHNNEFQEGAEAAATPGEMANTGLLHMSALVDLLLFGCL